MKVLVAQFWLFATPWTEPARFLCPWEFPGRNNGVGCHFLLQGIFPTQGLNPGLLHCRQILYCLSHKGNPIINTLKLTSFFLSWSLIPHPGIKPRPLPWQPRAITPRTPGNSPGDLPNSGIKSRSPALQAGSLPSEPPGKPLKMVNFILCVFSLILKSVSTYG